MVSAGFVSFLVAVDRASLFTRQIGFGNRLRRKNSLLDLWYRSGDRVLRCIALKISHLCISCRVGRQCGDRMSAAGGAAPAKQGNMVSRYRPGTQCHFRISRHRYSHGIALFQKISPKKDQDGCGYSSLSLFFPPDHYRGKGGLYDLAPSIPDDRSKPFQRLHPA